MEQILNQIREINFHKLSKEKLADNFEEVLSLISSHLSKREISKLAEDFRFYIQNKGRIWVHNTFAGGIIFLREPETIEKIKIEFNSLNDKAVASVEYETENRNLRNVKYKPNAGKVESTEWDMANIFPNFKNYEVPIQEILINIIGVIVKKTCEHLNTKSWFMKYEKDFEINICLDGSLKATLPVKTIK